MVDDVMHLSADPNRAAEINRRLVEAGVAVSELRVTERSLEEVFMQLTHREEA
jgi:ABC-2 type transport system ATP-binding protein